MAELMHSLPIFIRLQGRAVILIGDGEAAEAKRRLLERAGAMIVSEGNAGLAVVALEDDAEAGRVVAALKARGVLVNTVDRPDLCDFTFPAIIDRDPVLVAVGTGGASAGLAKFLRQRIENWLPQTVAPLAQALGNAREKMRARWPDAGERRRALDLGLVSGGLLETGDVAGWLTAGISPANRAVAIRLTSPDPDDMSLKQARFLGEADRIFVGKGVPQAVLDRARADAVRISGTGVSNPGPGLTVELTMETP